MPPVSFEPTIPASEQLQTYALDREATGTGIISLYEYYNISSLCLCNANPNLRYTVLKKQYIRERRYTSAIKSRMGSNLADILRSSW